MEQHLRSLIEHIASQPDDIKIQLINECFGF